MTKPPVPTLQRVADAAGVHRSTASRALNADTAHLLSPAVAKRIQDASAALGYRRDLMAVSLRTRRSGLIGVMVPDLANPLFGPLLGGVETVLATRGYTALIVNTDDDARLLFAVESLIARRVEGMLLATARQGDRTLAACLEAGIPTVMVNRADSAGFVSGVTTDDAAGMALAVAHLVALGHTAIGHVAGPANLSTGALRREGFAAAMHRAGLVGPIEAATGFQREAGRLAAAALLDAAALTAVVASNDMLALGVYQALAERGLRCPQDVSVVGHNDMPMADMVYPALTTVRIHPVEMGRGAAELLMAHIDEPSRAITRTVGVPALIERASTASPSDRR